MSTIITDVSRTPSGRFEVTLSDGSKANLSFSALMIEVGIITMEQSRLAFATQFNAADELLKAMQELNEIIQELNTLKSQFESDADGKDTIDDPNYGKKWQKEPFDTKTIVYYNENFKKIDDDNYTLKNQKKDIENITGNDKYTNEKSNKDKDYYYEIKTTYLTNPKTGEYVLDEDGEKKILKEEYVLYKRDKSDYIYTKLEEFSKKYPSLKIDHDLTDSGQYTKNSIEAAISNVQAQQSNISSLTEQQNMRTNQANSRVTGWLQQLQSLLQTLKEALQAAGKTGGM